MAYTFNPFTGNFDYYQVSGGVPTYTTFSAFPATATDGSLAVALDTDTLYVYNAASTSWLAIGKPGDALSVGTFDSGSPSAAGLTINASQALIAQSASTSNPGMVNTTTQSFAGNKTFTGSISASNLSGTNSGDVTLGTADGLSLSGQVLSLASASGTTTGALLSTDWTTFNNKQPAGNYITALTGDATATGPGSAALTLATVNSNVGQYTKVTVNGKGLITAATTLSAGDIPNLSATYVTQSEVGTANGVASLDSSGKVPVSQLPSVVMEYEGAWNPNTNSPALSDGTGTNGNVYYVTAQHSAAISGLTDPSMVNFQIGDLVIYSSSVGKWQLVTPAAGVQSVNGAQGAVVVNAINQLTGDVTTSAASGSQSLASSLVATTNGTLTTLSALTTASSLASVGTITTGTWNATTIAVSHGGTGQTSLTNHGVLVGAGTSGITQLAAAGAGTVMIGQGAGSDPTFTTSPTLGTTGGTTGQLNFASSGGSGLVTVQALSGAGAYNFNLPATAGTAGQALVSQGGGTSSMTWATLTTGTVTSVSATVPSFLSVSGSPITSSGTLAISLSGTALPVTSGGTGVITTPGNGQLLIGNSGAYSVANLTAGTGISIANGAGSITISTSAANGDIGITSFSMANNQSSAANVTGLSFANATVRSAQIWYSIAVSATTSLYEAGEIRLVQNGSGWYIGQTSLGDSTSVVFTVTSAGQVQYTTPNYTGFSSAKMEFRAIVTNV